MIDQQKIRIFYKYAIIFILINAVFIYYESFYFALIPFALVIAFFAAVSLDKVLMFVVALVPLSFPLREYAPNLPIDFWIPTEPLLFGILILFIFKMITERKFDRRILRHPISLAIYVNIGWMAVTVVTSSMPVVSLKFLVARLWFVVAFYFIATQLFRKIKNIKNYIWLYALPLIIVMFYAIGRHITIGLFDKTAAHYVMNPFFTDHTSYGAIMAMFIPVLVGLGTRGNYAQTKKLLIWVVIMIYLTAFIFSYTRAAWLSIVAAFGVWALVRLKIKFKFVLITALGIAMILLAFRTEILISMNQNTQDSSQNMEEHLQSMSNIRTDASNLERINRWNSALRMFAERPLFGWGPGTYMFNYASFQRSYELTLISTNAGDLGNAHSEYIGPLSESGLLGSLTYILLIIVVMRSGFKLYHRLEDTELRTLVLSAILGLFTYYLHGFLNNFLDTDKASAPFWGFTALIVAVDVYHSNKTEKKEEAIAE